MHSAQQQQAIFKKQLVMAYKTRFYDILYYDGKHEAAWARKLGKEGHGYIQH